jgi:hypothetical protein
MLARDKPNEPGIPPRGGRSAASRSRDGLTHQHLLGAGLNLDDRIILRAVRRDSPAATRPSLDGPGGGTRRRQSRYGAVTFRPRSGPLAVRPLASVWPLHRRPAPAALGTRVTARACGCVAIAAACPDHRLQWRH